MKAGRNRTIDFSVEQGQQYIEKCLHIDKCCSVDEILDKTIIGDSFKVLTFLPDNFVDLLIVDPPYQFRQKFWRAKIQKTVK